MIISSACVGVGVLVLNLNMSMISLNFYILLLNIINYHNYIKDKFNE